MPTILVGLLPALFFDPAAQGCGACPDNLLLVRGDTASWSSASHTALWLGFAAVTATAGVLAFELVRSSVVRLRLTAPVLVPAIAFLTAVAGQLGHGATRGFVTNDPVGLALWVVQGAALVLLSAGTLWERARAVRTRVAMRQLVVDVAGLSAMGNLEGAMRASLGDPTLKVLYPLSHDCRVNSEGRPDEPTAGQAQTPLIRGGETLAWVAHAPQLLEDPALVQDIGSVARLALDHERLQAETRAQLAALRASRLRIVESADAERRRLERDLHDGAQQRLVSLSLAIRLSQLQAAHDHPVVTERLAQAGAEVAAALADLRDLAHGLFPAVLTDEGLASALQVMAESGSTSLTLRALPDRRCDRPVEAAAYFVVAEGLRRLSCTHAWVGAAHTGPHLVVRLEGDGDLAADLTDVQDRVGALDGELSIYPLPRHRIAMEARLPCASS